MKRLVSYGNKIMAVLVILSTVIAIFLPQFLPTTNIQDYLVHYLIILILSGFIGLIINSKTILYVSFACAGILALFLKNASNTELKNPLFKHSTNITLVHLNLSLITEVSEIQKIIADTTVDLISFQEYTPDWENIIPLLMKENFRYEFRNVRMDIHGKAIFSKYPFISNKVLTFGDSPNLEADLIIHDDTLSIVSTYLTPALDALSTSEAKGELASISEYIHGNPQVKLVLGEFNQVYWSHDILAFRTKTGLLNSRRNVYPTTLKVPYDHIFYKKDLECYQFDELNDLSGQHIGCMASFQFKNDFQKMKE